LAAQGVRANVVATDDCYGLEPIAADESSHNSNKTRVVTLGRDIRVSLYLLGSHSDAIVLRHFRLPGFRQGGMGMLTKRNLTRSAVLTLLASAIRKPLPVGAARTTAASSRAQDLVEVGFIGGLPIVTNYSVTHLARVSG